MRRVMIGPPGTGKTYRLVREELPRALNRGVAPEEIALVSFTKAAASSASTHLQEALDLEPDALPGISTIHSAALRQIALDRRDEDTDIAIVDDAAWRKKFGPQFGYEFSRSGAGDTPWALPRTTADDALRVVYAFQRSRGLSPEQGLAACSVSVPAREYLVFVKRFEDFKRTNGMLDFDDMIDLAMSLPGPAPRVAFHDEAQDSSPRQIALLDRWFASCEEHVIAGDDDQNIYSWAGSDPSWLTNQAQIYPTEVLTQSKRVPRRSHALANRIIARNRARLPKVYLPRAEAGVVLRLVLADAIRLAGDGCKKAYVLCRNRLFLPHCAELLVRQGISYCVLGGGAWDPLALETARVAMLAAGALAHDESLKLWMAGALCAAVPDARIDLIPRAARQAVAARRSAIDEAKAKGDDAGAQALLRAFDGDMLGLSPLRDLIRRCGPASILLKERPEVRGYFARISDAHGRIAEPKVTLTTVHMVKGEQAHTVVVVPDMTQATYRAFQDGRHGGYELENRIMYVAVTRASQRLILVDPMTDLHYDFPGE